MTEKNEEKSIEKEIIASYEKGMSTSAIKKEYDISAFEFAYILGKHNVQPRQQRYRRLGDDTMIVHVDGTLGIPKSVIRTLGFEYKQKLRFVIVDKQHLTLQLQEIK